MKKHCPCGRFVALIKGGHIRRGTEMVCRECYERLQAADAVARMASNEAAKMPYPFGDIFK